MTVDDRLSTFSNDGLTFEVIDRGPIDGEVVVCLHGFPQPATCWDGVADRLVESGFRALAPTQRGYSAGARPERRRDYASDKLAGDVVALLDAAGADRAHVVGHDWGGLVAWQVAADHPGRVATLTAVSTPHPGALRKAMFASTQGLHSWYMAAFQIPKVPEWLLAKGGADRIRKALAGDGLGTTAATQSAALLGDPATARAMINWYRALPYDTRHPVGTIGVPTVYVWSDGDRYLGRHAAEHTADWMTGEYRFIEIPGGSHWLPDQHPDRVAEAIVTLAGEHPATA